MNQGIKTRFANSERGAVTIEFVCTLPLFLAALAFAFELGQFFLAHQSTVHNVRAATRFLSRLAPAANVDEARNIVRTGRINGGDAPEYLDDADIEIRDIDPLPRDVNIWRVQATVTYRPLLMGFLGGDAITIPFVVREDFRIVGR
jgi:hypothetical protein